MAASAPRPPAASAPLPWLLPATGQVCGQAAARKPMPERPRKVTWRQRGTRSRETAAATGQALRPSRGGPARRTGGPASRAAVTGGRIVTDGCHACHIPLGRRRLRVPPRPLRLPQPPPDPCRNRLAPSATAAARKRLAVRKLTPATCQPDGPAPGEERPFRPDRAGLRLPAGADPGRVTGEPPGPGFPWRSAQSRPGKGAAHPRRKPPGASHA